MGNDPLKELVEETERLGLYRDGRPRVIVSALTANTCEVVIETDEGTVRLVCSHDVIKIEAKGTKIDVSP